MEVSSNFLTYVLYCNDHPMALCASHFTVIPWKKILNPAPLQRDTNLKDLLLKNPHHLMEIVTEKTISNGLLIAVVFIPP